MAELLEMQVQMSPLALLAFSLFMYATGVGMEKFLQSRKRKLTREDFAEELLSGAREDLARIMRDVETRRKKPVDL